jgi:F0F1-type ATP synthase delta subunit
MPQQTMPVPPTPPAVNQQATANQPPEFVLSDAIATRVDVGRLARELDELDNYLLQSKIRQGGQPNTLLPKLSSMLEQLAADNQLNLLHDDGRRTLIKYLAHIKDKSPIIHVSFASDPSGMFISRLIMWFRQNIHPYALLQIGLQPQIAAGCIVRTSSKYYDFSLRKTLEKSKPLLGELLEAAR